MKLVDKSQDVIYTDPAQPVEARVADLISRMTLEEKVSQMVHGAAAIEHLGVPAYNWWNECLHGVGRAAGYGGAGGHRRLRGCGHGDDGF